jgi:hypothetical protein
MNTKTEEKDNTNQKPFLKSMGDVIANGITRFLVGLLSFSCQVVQTTPSSIVKQNPNARPNSPPPSGGISSLGN